MSTDAVAKRGTLRTWLSSALSRDLDSTRVFCIGIVAYVAPNAGMRLGARWFDELKDPAAFSERFHILRRKFWNGFAKAVVVAMSALGGLALAGHGTPNAVSWLRIFAAILALTATLGRGGWDIQSYKGQTVVERIDRGMYLIGQLGAFALLVLLLGW
jgi:hypothetical protein